MASAPAVKIQSDIDFIAESSRIVAETLQLVGKSVAPGVTTRELDEIAEDYIRSRGGVPAFKGHKVDGLEFPSTLCISVDDAVVHGIPGDHILQEGQIVSIDCGCKKDGFYGDSAHTFAVGEISDEKRHLLQVTQDALQAGIDQAVTRNKVYQISGAIERVVVRNHCSVVRELAGHGIGRNLHEEPSIPNFVPPLLHRKQYPNVKLRQGMALAIEPMVIIGSNSDVITDRDKWTIRAASGQSAAHFEHTVIVQDNQPLILTQFS